MHWYRRLLAGVRVRVASQAARLLTSWVAGLAAIFIATPVSATVTYIFNNQQPNPFGEAQSFNITLPDYAPLQPPNATTTLQGNVASELVTDSSCSSTGFITNGTQYAERCTGISLLPFSTMQFGPGIEGLFVPEGSVYDIVSIPVCSIGLECPGSAHFIFYFFDAGALEHAGSYATSYVTNFNSATLEVIDNSAVPELSTWAMMLLGFSVIGVGARRRRSAQAPFTL